MRKTEFSASNIWKKRKAVDAINSDDSSPGLHFGGKLLGRTTKRGETNKEIDKYYRDLLYEKN